MKYYKYDFMKRAMTGPTRHAWPRWFVIGIPYKRDLIPSESTLECQTVRGVLLNFDARIEPRCPAAYRHNRQMAINRTQEELAAPKKATHWALHKAWWKHTFYDTMEDLSEKHLKELL